VARELLGKLLVRRKDGRRLTGMIVETEAYVGEEDTACHASRGRTARTEVLFGPPGQAYVYFTYGMHWMLNAVTEREGRAAAVLIRAVEPVEGLEEMRRLRPGRPDRELTAGPGRLCSALAVDHALNRADLVRGAKLWIEPYRELPRSVIAAGPRVGIAYAQPRDRSAPWRFWVAGNGCVSRARPGQSAG
jgi:DNA-3-methyladenine glycosylase